MKARIIVAIGLLLAATGVLWTLQGLGIVGGSAMSGVTTWAVVGPLVVVVALVITYIGFRRLRG
ncbi:hypothetical protein AB0M50_47190 [Nonomuraea fuscirosea]|jgi:hypothetical protein|uniref:hypothetical protein n=1 Tax=Nonomuraea fuscirosea TaxID=1291556 RepID=UPI002DDC4F7E|nr:hypothetical protein [Nonomuraea fuscirosea]WSA55667.1 hypothetical protein OIE67_14005 [Nonomuraea fuscirosea]